MRIVLSSDGSVELLRGERITRGQDLSRRIYVEWNENESPIDTGQILADNMAVQLCITRPDGEQSGWYSMIKIDAEDKYYYTLQAWDTAVSGQASLQVRWYDITQEEENRIIEVSNEAFFIVDNGKIAQPLNLSSENYNEIVLQFITPLSAQALRRYDINKLPDTITFNIDGAKTAPALYFNFTHDVVDLVPSENEQEYDIVVNSRNGTLLVNKNDKIQTEIFIDTRCNLYSRTFSTSESAGEFKSLFEENILNAEIILHTLAKTMHNLEKGTGDYSIVQKTAEGEENEATAEGTYAGGKKSKSTAKRGFTHGNTVLNNGNSAASFGQQYTNDGNCALTQQVGGYNGGAGAVVVGQEIYNKKNQTANVVNNEGGAAAAIVGAYLYNRGSHAQIMGYLLKNRKALKTVLGIANEDKENTVFEIGRGKEITTVASDGKTFTYKDYVYTVNYDETGKKPISITFPENAPDGAITLEIGDDYRVETSQGLQVCIVMVNDKLKVYEPYNLFEIDESGNVVTKGNIDGKKLTITHLELLGSMVGQTGKFTDGFSAFKGLAKLLLKDDGVEVQGKGKFDGDVSGYKGTFSDGFYAKKQLAELELKDNGVRVQGKMSVSNRPENSTDVVRQYELNVLRNYIDGLHKSQYQVVSALPTASEDTLMHIYLVPNENSPTGDEYGEYITIAITDNGAVTYKWEKIGATQFAELSSEAIEGLRSELSNSLTELETQINTDIKNKLVKQLNKGSTGDIPTYYSQSETLALNRDVEGNLRTGNPVGDFSAVPLSYIKPFTDLYVHKLLLNCVTEDKTLSLVVGIYILSNRSTSYYDGTYYDGGDGGYSKAKIFLNSLMTLKNYAQSGVEYGTASIGLNDCISVMAVKSNGEQIYKTFNRENIRLMNDTVITLREHLLQQEYV